MLYERICWCLWHTKLILTRARNPTKTHCQGNVAAGWNVWGKKTNSAHMQRLSQRLKSWRKRLDTKKTLKRDACRNAHLHECMQTFLPVIRAGKRSTMEHVFSQTERKRRGRARQFLPAGSYLTSSITIPAKRTCTTATYLPPEKKKPISH